MQRKQPTAQHPASPPARRTARVDWGCVLTIMAAMLGSAYVPWLFAVPADSHVRVLVSDLVVLPLSAATVALAWRASRAPGLHEGARRGWRLLAAAYLLYGLGNVLWAWTELVLLQEPSTSIADLAYLAFYPVMLSALLSFPAERTSREGRAKFWLDAAVVVVGAATFIWYLILRPIAGRGPGLETALALAYPVCDLLLLFGTVVVSHQRAQVVSQLPLRLLVAGLGIFFSADLAYAYSIVSGLPLPRITDAGWIVAEVLMVHAAHASGRWPTSRARTRSRRSRSRGCRALPISPRQRRTGCSWPCPATTGTSRWAG